MNWMHQLAETYDKCRTSIGYGDQAGQRPLLPICHITTQAHVEIAIDGKGNFRRARLITDKSDSTTIHPCTEDSGSRSGTKPVNHPFCDKLQYVAGDFAKWGGAVTSGFAGNPQKPHQEYLKTLRAWCESEYRHPKAIAVLNYVDKGTVVGDLVSHGILLVDGAGQFVVKEAMQRPKGARDIFSVLDSQEDAFVRWVVEEGEGDSRTWRDPMLWDSWARYYLSSKEEKSLCYVTGEDQLIASTHPRSIRCEGDGAKLISANDTSGFTFRGRFLNDREACGVGLQVTQKAHFALAWLIDRQGYRKDDLAVVAWATSGNPLPQPTDDSWLLLFGDAPTETPESGHTAENVGLQLKKRIAGYGTSMGDTDSVGVIALDSATTGRLAITYYRTLTGSDYLERIDDWHESCAWLHRYKYREVQDESSGKSVWRPVSFVGAPAPADIVEAAYGSTVDDKLRKAAIRRLLPCIVDEQPLPHDLTESVVRRASNRAGLDEREWEKALSIACALFRKQNKQENFQMALDTTRKTRDYLYGRALALADSLEEWALSEAGETRETTAARLMQRFAERPFSTWRSIELALAPYKARLGPKSRKYQQEIDEVIAAFDPDDFIRDKPLSGEFLLGYHSQREASRMARGKNDDAKAGTDPEIE